MSGSYVSFLPDIVVYGVGGGLGACLCGISCYFFFTRCFLVERRAIIDSKHHMPVEVLIIEKVVEEVKYDSGPPRELTRRELKKQREREQEKAAKERERLATAGGRRRDLRSPTKDGEGKRGGWFSWFYVSRKDAKIAGEEQEPIVTALENVAIVGEPSAAGGVDFDIEEGLAEKPAAARKREFWTPEEEEEERIRKADKKAQKEAKKRAALEAAKEEEELNSIDKAEKAAEDEKQQIERLKASSSKHHEAVAKREARRQKIKDDEEKAAAEAMLQKFLEEETLNSDMHGEMERRER